jgi:hypothetical protein
MLALFLVVFVALFVGFKLAWWTFKLTFVASVVMVGLAIMLTVAVVRALRT